jgi:hypothetical protein
MFELILAAHTSRAAPSILFHLPNKTLRRAILFNYVHLVRSTPIHGCSPHPSHPLGCVHSVLSFTPVCALFITRAKARIRTRGATDSDRDRQQSQTGSRHRRHHIVGVVPRSPSCILQQYARPQNNRHTHSLEFENIRNIIPSAHSLAYLI